MVQITLESHRLTFFDCLGQWLAPPHWEWEWFYAPSTQMVYHQTGSYYHVYHPITGTRVPTFVIHEVVDGAIPPDAGYATADFDRWGRVRFQGWKSSLDQDQQP